VELFFRGLPVGKKLVIADVAGTVGETREGTAGTAATCSVCNFHGFILTYSLIVLVNGTAGNKHTHTHTHPQCTKTNKGECVFNFLNDLDCDTKYSHFICALVYFVYKSDKEPFGQSSTAINLIETCPVCYTASWYCSCDRTVRVGLCVARTTLISCWLVSPHYNNSAVGCCHLAHRSYKLSPTTNHLLCYYWPIGELIIGSLTAKVICFPSLVSRRAALWYFGRPIRDMWDCEVRLKHWK